ncbi:MAG: hypothetical protein UD936_00725, partial [Acutalibacteraceae bacterium]|nr:hypothetical protein [Acutalibacteraceae bacterium]
DVNSGFVDETMSVADRDVHEVVLSSNSTSASKNPTAKMPITQQFDRANYDNTTTTLQQVVAASQVTKPTGSFTNGGTGFATAAGTTFLWSDTNTSKNGTASSGSGVGVVATNGGVDLLYNQSAVFNDQFVVNSTIQLVPQDALKTFVSGYPSPGAPANSIVSGRLASDYYDSNLDLRNNGNNKVTISDDGKFSFGSANSSGEKITATYTNTVKTGTVQFTKKLAQGEDADNNTVFYFTIDFANVFGGTNSDFAKYNVIYKVKNADGTISSDANEYALKTNGIELKVGQTAIVEGVPVGTRYRILETGTSNDSKGYAVANVTAGTENKENAYVESTPLSNGVEAKVATKLTGENNVTHLDFNNTTKSTAVLYRFYDRHIEKGLPTSMETHYTYFTREMPGTLTGTEADIDTIINYAPTIKNPLKEYSIIEDDENNIHSIDFNHVLTDADLANAEGLPSEYVAGKTVHLVTYFDTDRLYTVEYECRDDNGNIASGTVEPPADSANPGTKLKGYPFNSLIELNKLRTAKTYKDAEGTEHAFRYWSIATSNGKGGTIYTPVSSNFSYAYRVTSDIVLKAVYEGEDGYTQLPAPICVTGKGYNVTGLGSGHDAASTEKVYDSYSKDLANGTTQDRTRINVMFSSVGSEDTDRNITHMGYILLYNQDGYATDELFTEEHLLEQIKDSGDYTKLKNITDINGKSYPVQVRAYGVENHMTLTPSIDDGGNVTTWTPSEYISGKVALTNKNRATLVFDLAHTEASKAKYYTCYTIMTRVDEEFDSEGNYVVGSDGKAKIKTYNYVSDTPVYFNLKEAEPYIKDVEVEDNSYEVKTHVVDQNGNTNTSAGTVTPSTTFIKDGSLLTITVHQSDYTLDGVSMKSTLKSLKIGNVLIEADKFAECGLTATGTSAYTFKFEKDTYLVDTDTLDVTATFNVVADTSEVIVDVNTVTCTNGSIQVSTDGTTYSNSIKVKKGETFKVKATPASGYELTGWSDATLGTSTVITLTVPQNGVVTLPTPTFAKATYTLKLTAGLGGKITYSYTNASGESKSGTIANNTSGTLTNIPKGGVVSLTAVKDVDGATFEKWSDGTTTTTYSYTVNANSELKANFVTGKYLKFNITVNASWDIYQSNAEFYLTYLSTDGTRTITAEPLTSPSNNKFTAYVPVDEKTSSWKLYLIRCSKGNTKVNANTTTVNNNDGIWNVSSADIQSGWIAGVPNGGNYDISFSM